MHFVGLRWAKMAFSKNALKIVMSKSWNKRKHLRSFFLCLSDLTGALIFEDMIVAMNIGQDMYVVEITWQVIVMFFRRPT